MSQARVQAVLQAAIEKGLLPAHAQLPAQDTRPWPVVLLTAIGAWLAAVPLMVLVSMLFGGFLGQHRRLLPRRGPAAGSRHRGAALARVAAFRRTTGRAGIAGRRRCLRRGADARWADAARCCSDGCAGVGLAALVPRAWLRSLLGATAAVLLAVAWLPARWQSGPDPAGVDGLASRAGRVLAGGPSKRCCHPARGRVGPAGWSPWPRVGWSRPWPAWRGGPA